MPRQPKWVAAGIYQPTYQPRHAYGPRRRGRCEQVEDYAKQCGVVNASEIARYGGAAALSGGLAGLQLFSVPMPRGGLRWLMACPRCHDRVTRLYERWHPFFQAYRAACRKCWGLRYRSQYEGRRLEAHPDYLQTVARHQIDRTPFEPRHAWPVPARRQMAMYRHGQRMRRFATAQDVRGRRTQRWIARKDLALDISLMILLARSEAGQRRRWRKILWHKPHIPTLQYLIEHEDTPEWARALLKQHLERAELGVKALLDVRKGVKNALETDETTQLNTFIEQARIDDLRTRYAALGQGRRARQAA